MTNEEWLAQPGGARTLCLTEKLKFGGMAPVYFHYDVTEDGTVVRRQMSVPGKSMEKDIGNLLDAIADRINSDTVPDEKEPA